MKVQLVVLTLGLLACQSNAAKTLTESVQNALKTFLSSIDLLAINIKNGMKTELDATRNKLLADIAELKISKSVTAEQDACIEVVVTNIKAVTYEPLSSCVDTAIATAKSELAALVTDLKVQLKSLDDLLVCLIDKGILPCINLALTHLEKLKTVGDLMQKLIIDLIVIINKLIEALIKCEQKAAGRACLAYVSLALDVARCL